MSENLVQLQRKLAAMREELNLCKKDADRYRWLCNGGLNSLPYDDFGCGPVFDLSDEAVDSAMSQ
jgi:hypothetical protein